MEDRDCDWYCDYCHVYLNNQSGFTTISESWVCEYCGNVNDVSDNNIIPDEGTHGRYVYETTYEDGTTEKIRFTKKYEVLENVKNIMNHDNGNTFKRIIHELESLGYMVYYHVFNSADYGVPQRRNRCYIVAFLGEYFNSAEFVFPPTQPLRVKTQDLLDEEVEAKYFLSKKIVKTILGKGTKNYIVEPTIDLPISKTLTATMAKMHRASQDNYVTDEKNYAKLNDTSKVSIRKLTPNECRKLQGFPSDWKQVVSDCQAYKQFGNAVTVNVSYALAKTLMPYIDKNKKDNW